MGRLLVAAPAALAAFALAGCGTIDADKLEEEISKGFAPELQQVDASVASVSCPDDIDSETGAKFDCTITTDEDVELLVNVEITNGEEGDVEYRLAPESIRELALGGGKPS